MLDPIFMTTGTLETNLRQYGIDYEIFMGWSDEDAERVSALILEWSKRWNKNGRLGSMTGE